MSQVHSGFTKQMARNMFYGGTVFFALLFAALIFDSERLTVTAHFTDFPLYYGPAQVGFPGRAKIYSDSVRLIRER